MKYLNLTCLINNYSLNYLNLSNNTQLDSLKLLGTGVSNIDLRNCINLKYAYLQSGSVCINQLQINSVIWKSENPLNYNTNCIDKIGDYSIKPIKLNSNTIYLDTTTNFTKESNSNVICNTAKPFYNTIDIFYTFIAPEVNPNFTLSLSDPNWEAKIALIDTVNFNILPNNTCKTVNGGGQFSFSNLTIGQKYMFRLEIGGTSPLGHARTDVSANTFSVQLNPTVTSIDSEALLNQNKTLQSIYNLQGIEVDKNYNGLVIYRYTDGTIQKVLQ